MNRSNHDYHSHRLYRDSENGLLCGVCAGLANWLAAPRWLVRIATLAVGWIFPIPVVVAYFVGAFVLRQRPLHYFGDGDERRFWHSHRHGD